MDVTLATEGAGLLLGAECYGCDIGHGRVAIIWRALLQQAILVKRLQMY